MNPTNKDKTKTIAWRVGELVLGILALIYFLGYPRDTLSDFIVLTSLCVLLMLSYTKIGLIKPLAKPFSKADNYLILVTLLLFITAWTYGMLNEKLNGSTAVKSILITVGYFYYAFIQHFLAQRYLSLRLFAAIEKSGFVFQYGLSQKTIAALLTGLIFGVLHIPYPGLILPSMVGGFLYSYYFLTTGRLWLLVSSHALVSSAVIFWCLDDNPFTELMVLF
jgi:membrane protease YdiL (CAAX protease family)